MYQGGGLENQFSEGVGCIGDLFLDLHAYRIPLEMVMEFKYRGRVFIASDDNWPTVVSNLRKDRSIWAQLSRILGLKITRPLSLL